MKLSENVIISVLKQAPDRLLYDEVNNRKREKNALGGRPKGKGPHCVCGDWTVIRATKRYHICTVSVDVLKAQTGAVKVEFKEEATAGEQPVGRVLVQFKNGLQARLEEQQTRTFSKRLATSLGAEWEG